VLEGDKLAVAVEILALTEVERLELELQLRGGPPTAPRPPVLSARLRNGERREFSWTVAVEHWGVRRLDVACRAHHRFGLVEYEIGSARLGTVRVFPRIETLRALIGPIELQAVTGSRVSRDLGEGIEFAEVRPYLPGDRVRRVNWRVTARRAAPYVSERHPERDADVILFLDTFAEVGNEHGSTLQLAVRAAASLAAAYLARKDRVGLVSFGGVLSGLGPRLGDVGLYRIVDALLGSEVVFSYAEKDLRFVPRNLLPAKALVIAISPMIDERALGAMLDLRARGFDLAVVDISPVPFAPPGRTPSDALGHRLWLMRRELVRARMQELGVPVTEWRGDGPLQAPIATASEFRRHARHTVSR
jgi:uncharacterized protein (DUF58 family)